MYREFPVTMSEPYSDLEDLRKKAWQELFVLLRQFAELSRRETGSPDLSFKNT